MDSIKNYAPIILFTYSRFSHTSQTVSALLKNPESKYSDLIVYCDGPKSNDENDQVLQVRSFLNEIVGFKSLTLNFRDENIGLSRSIISGLNEVLQKYDKAIVIEDDIVTSPFFLKYMNDGLSIYSKNDNVASIHGYVYPVERELPETFFLRGADCWGWGTWRRAWSKFNPDGKELLNQLNEKNLTQRFDFNGSYSFSNMLLDQIHGKNDSWAIRWHASTYLENMFTLYPRCSLVNNIGHDNTGTHSIETTKFDSKFCDVPIKIFSIPVEESHIAFNEFENYFNKSNQLFVNQTNKILFIINNLKKYFAKIFSFIKAARFK